MTGYEPDDRVTIEDQRGTVISSDDERTVIELDDGRTIDVPTRAVDPPPIDPDDTEDGVHEWAHGMGDAP